MSNFINCYEIMKIANFSTLDEIKAKYKELMIKYHPDKGGDSTIFNNYKQAYDYLKEYKDQHDRKLKCN
jgi:curved DNA-binding protein CbpA